MLGGPSVLVQQPDFEASLGSTYDPGLEISQGTTKRGRGDRPLFVTGAALGGNPPCISPCSGQRACDCESQGQPRPTAR
jgi:hypothetical protein